MSETFKIHLQGTSDTQQWLKAEGQLRKLDNAANDFINSLKQGVGIDLGGKLVNSIAQLPQMFGNILERGYEFNKTMAQSEGGLANILAKFMKLDAVAAKQEAAKAMAAISEWEPKAAGSLQDLTQGFMATVGAGQAAGITVEQNVELVGKFANALAALGMDASQLTQELRAIFTGNITPDAQLAKTLEITPQAVKAAKDAGTFYEFLNKQLGTLGDAAAGPAVALSSLQSVIDKAAGALSKGLFDEVIAGAEELTTVLGDPAIKRSLEEAGVGIGQLVAQGVNLTVWAAKNAPLLMQVAEGAVRIGAAIAGIKLATIIAGLVLKAQRWAAVTNEVMKNTAALSANSAAAAASTAGTGKTAVTGSLATGAATAGAAAGKAGAAGMWASFSSSFSAKYAAGLSLIVVGLTTKIMSQAGEIMSQLGDWEKQTNINAKNLQTRKHPTEVLRETIGQAGTPQDVAAARRLGGIMQRDAKADGNEVLLNQINAIMGKFDELVGKQVDHKKAAAEAASAEAAFNASLIAGKAAAGDSAAQIKLATDSVDALVKKLEEASGTKLDSSTFESLLKSVQGLDTSKLDEDAAKGVAALIEAAGKLRDLKAAAADEENQMRDDAAAHAKQNAEEAIRRAEELRRKKIEQLEIDARVAEAEGKTAAAKKMRGEAEALTLEGQGFTPAQAAKVVAGENGKAAAEDIERKNLAKEMAALEDEIAAKRAHGDMYAADAAEDRLAALQLARQLEEQLGITRTEAELRAKKRVADQRASTAGGAVADSSEGLGDQTRRAIRLSAADTWGDGRALGGLRGNGRSSIDLFKAQQSTPLRSTFQFPALDAFAARQSSPAAASSASGVGDAASKMAASTAASDAAIVATLKTVTEQSEKTKREVLELQQRLKNSRA